MSWWNRDLREADIDALDLAYPPGGGPLKKILLGIALPLALAVQAARVWIHAEITLSYRGISSVAAGDSALAIAVAFAGAALFCHARWFWGLLGHYTAFERLTILAALVILAGLGGFLCFEFYT